MRPRKKAATLIASEDMTVERPLRGPDSEPASHPEGHSLAGGAGKMSANQGAHLLLLRGSSTALLSAFKGFVYFLSFLGPVLLLHSMRALPVPVLLAAAIAGYGVAGGVFLLALVLTKKFLVGPVTTTGILRIDTAEGKRWFASAMLVAMQQDGLFRSMTGGLSLIGPWFFRGMGAVMPSSTLPAGGVGIRDPYFLELGENVTIGGGAFILGHLGNGKEIILGRVSIGDGTIIGGRSTIFPDVCIGKNVRIGVGAVVTRGTVIPDNERWGGVPARKISPKPV